MSPNEYEEYEKIQTALDVLSDPIRRKKYDETGIIIEGPTSKTSSQFFITFLGRRKRVKKMRDVCHPLKVTLEELYNGTSRNILVRRNRVIKDSIKG